MFRVQENIFFSSFPVRHTGFHKISFHSQKRIIGVFYYFLTEQVRTLVQAMADSFPGGVLVFDAANRTAVKMIAKTWLRSAKIQDVGAYFAVSDAKSEISPWNSRLQVTSRGYMLGYNDLRDPSVSGLFRFLARTGDRIMKMQIVRICFGQR